MDDKQMREKLEKVKKGFQSCRDCACKECPYQIDGKYCTADALDDDMYEVIEYLEKKVEDQQERIDIMAADVPVRCKECKYWKHTPDNTTSFWKPCDELQTEPHYFCWCGKLKGSEEE